MTDKDFQHQERLLSEALHRFTGRFPPKEPEWARIEARHAGTFRAPASRRRVGSLLGSAAVAACIVLVAGVLLRSEHVSSPSAEAGGFVGRQYAEVSAREFQPGTTMAEIKARGFIRVGIKFDQPNFGFRQPRSSEPVGFDTEIARLIAMGIFGGNVNDIDGRIHWIEAVSKNREGFLANGTVDIVVATYSITDERKALVDFVGPYFLARQDIMVRAEDRSITGVNDLDDRRVCTAQGSTSYDHLVQRNPKAVPVLRDTYSDCAKALLSGEVEAVTTDQGILEGYAHESGGRLRVLYNPLWGEDYGIGLKKGDEAFRSFLHDRLTQVVANGDWLRAARFSLSNSENLPLPAVTPQVLGREPS
jgi:glutamate transport system substrate-binding protein